jgi:hypothetical protein
LDTLFLPEDGIFSFPVAAAGSKIGGGSVSKGAQKMVTLCLDEAALCRVTRRIKGLVWYDPRKQAFMNLNETSTSFVGSIPTAEDAFNNVDYGQACQDYLGLPSAQMRPHAGKVRWRGDPLDEFGNMLTNAQMSGDGWRKRHDAVKWIIFSLLQMASIPSTCEVWGLFTAAVQQSPEVLGLSARVRQAIVPDFKIHIPGKMDSLYELKCISQSQSYFTSGDDNEWCAGVQRRAKAVHPSYIAKAKKADRKYNGFVSVGGSLGPLELMLGQYGVVRALVVGPRGEASKDLITLLRDIAKVAGDRLWRDIGADSPDEANGHFLQRIYRTVGITAVREAALLKRERLGFILSNDGSAPYAVRQAAQKQAEEARREYFESSGGFPGGRSRRG